MQFFDKLWIFLISLSLLSVQAVTVFLGSIALGKGERYHINLATGIFNHLGFDENTLANDISVIRLPQTLKYSGN